MYVCLGDGTGNHADICIAFSKDLIRWDKEDTPLYVVTSRLLHPRKCLSAVGIANALCVAF